MLPPRIILWAIARRCLPMSMRPHVSIGIQDFLLLLPLTRDGYCVGHHASMPPPRPRWASAASCLNCVTASAWAITRRGLPIAHGGRHRLSFNVQLAASCGWLLAASMRLSSPSVGSPSVGAVAALQPADSPSVGAVIAVRSPHRAVRPAARPRWALSLLIVLPTRPRWACHAIRGCSLCLSRDWLSQPA